MLSVRDHFRSFAIRGSADRGPSKTWSKQNVFCFLAGLLAGCAMACKYTGLALVVIPAGLILLWAEWRRVTTGKFQKIVLVAMIYSFGVFLSIGPWLIKNAVETGNPVYPLAVNFGGVDRDPDIDAKFRHGHAATSFESWGKRLQNLAVSLADVSANNDWHSPLLFGLAPLTLLLFLKLALNHRLNDCPASRYRHPVALRRLSVFHLVGADTSYRSLLCSHVFFRRSPGGNRSPVAGFRFGECVTQLAISLLEPMLRNCHRRFGTLRGELDATWDLWIQRRPNEIARGSRDRDFHIGTSSEVVSRRNLGRPLHAKDENPFSQAKQDCFTHSFRTSTTRYSITSC